MSSPGFLYLYILDICEGKGRNFCYALWIPDFSCYEVETLWDTFSFQKLRVPIDLYILDLHRNK